MRLLDDRSHFYQWDLNQRLTAEGLEVGDELHFANALSTEALVVKAYALEDGTVVADVPNTLLRDAYPVTAYRYVAEGTAEHTIKAHTFQVQKRPRPSDYIYTETEVHSFEQLAEKVKEALGKMEGFDGDKQAEMIEALEEADEAIREELSKKDDALKSLREADVAIRADLGKKADATATEQAIAGKSAVKVGGEVVAEFDADTKLEKNTVQGWGVRVYAVENSGEQNMYALSGLPSPLSIAFRRAGGALNVGTATEEAHAVPLAQMNEALTEKADAKAVDTLAKKVENIEAGTAADAFIVDDSTAYIKPIPTGVAPYAELLAVGGMTHKVERYGDNLLSTSYVSMFEPEMSADGDTIYMSYTSYGWSAMLCDLFRNVVVGNKYILSVSAFGGDLYPASIDTGGVPCDTPFTLTEEYLYASFEFSNGYADDGGAGQPCGGTFKVSLREVSNELLATPVTALEIRNASGEITHTFAIPAAVQALEGYGWGITSNAGKSLLWNSIEWDENGKPTFVKRVDKVVYNGTESWGRGTYNGYIKFEIGISKLKGNTVVIADRFVWGTPSATLTNCLATTPRSICVYPSNPPDTVEGWKAQLAEWYAEGDPLTVYYELKEPIVTDISHLLTEDTFLAVEGGGTITAANEHSLAAPSTIVYRKRGF